MEKGRKNGPMALSLSVSSNMARKLVRDSSAGPTGQPTRAKLLIISFMGMALILGQLRAASMLATGRRTVCMVKVY